MCGEDFRWRRFEYGYMEVELVLTAHTNANILVMKIFAVWEVVVNVCRKDILINSPIDTMRVYGSIHLTFCKIVTD